ncbi:MAG: hypothetical protein ABIK28_19625 [Planctomycetota bacterium]
MYFYVFLQPDVFDEAVSDGADAIQSVVGILTGLLQNCFLAVFEDYRWDESVKEKVEAWPPNMSRKRVKTILAQMKKGNRLLYSLVPDYEGTSADLKCVFDQATTNSLDLILMVEGEEEFPSPAGVELATRPTYQESAFEPMRSDLAVYGKTCTPEELDEMTFLEFHFQKALRFATEIHICDRLCGAKSFTGNFRYTVRQLFTWLGRVLEHPESCSIFFHIEKPSGKGDVFVIGEIDSIKKASLPSTPIEIRFYEKVDEKSALPHQRFIATDQVALNVERGLDFLDQGTKRCRDTFITYQNPEETRRLLSLYASQCVSRNAV